MKKSKNLMVITTLCDLIPMVVGLILWNKLPSSMPVHFDFNGVANGFASKTLVVFGMPIFFALVQFICLYFVSNDPKKENIGAKMLGAVAWLFVAITNITCLCIYGIALGYNLSMNLLVTLLLGFVFIIFGNYMGKNHQNYTVGIRLPWTLHSQANWNQTHRLASKIWMICGIIIIGCGIFNQMYLMCAIMIAMIIIPIVYSFLLYKKGI